MFKKPVLFLILLILLFSSCQTINKSNSKLGITQSCVFLSFDDGPDADTTPLLLEVLEKYHIKAIFCLLGVNAEQYPELVRQIHDSGHYIANHGYSEKWSIKMKDDEFRNNILQGENAISLGMGQAMEPKLYRPHGGFYNSRQEKICSDEKYAIIPVSIRVYDAVKSSESRDKIINNVIRKVTGNKRGLILLHDCRESHLSKAASLEKNPGSSFNRTWVPHAAEEIIIALTEKGFVFPDPEILINSLYTSTYH